VIKRLSTAVSLLGFVLALAAPALAGKPSGPLNKHEREGTCAPYGMYEADKLDKCKRECSGNRQRCAKKQWCKDKPCPEPGYCWLCVKE